MNKLYTAQEIADKLKIKKTTVYELIKRGELGSSKIGKQLRISEEQLNRYLQGGDASVSEAPLPFPGFQPESSLLKRDYLLYSNGLIISGQASPALEYLINQMAVHPNGLPVLHSHLNTYNGLYSLYFKKVHATTAGILPEHIPALLPGMSVAAFVLYEYSLGFYVQKGNPKNILSVSDLKRPDVALANREKGSTGRMYLDILLKDAKILPDQINGYQKELVSCNGNGIPEPARFFCSCRNYPFFGIPHCSPAAKRLQHLPNRRNIISVKRKRSPKGERFRFTHLYYSSVS